MFAVDSYSGALSLEECSKAISTGSCPSHMGCVWPRVASHEEHSARVECALPKSPWEAGFAGTSLPSSKQPAGVHLRATSRQNWHRSLQKQNLKVKLQRIGLVNGGRQEKYAPKSMHRQNGNIALLQIAFTYTEYTQGPVSPGWWNRGCSGLQWSTLFPAGQIPAEGPP